MRGILTDSAPLLVRRVPRAPACPRAQAARPDAAREPVEENRAGRGRRRTAAAGSPRLAAKTRSLEFCARRRVRDRGGFFGTADAVARNLRLPRSYPGQPWTGQIFPPVSGTRSCAAGRGRPRQKARVGQQTQITHCLSALSQWQHADQLHIQLVCGISFGCADPATSVSRALA